MAKQLKHEFFVLFRRWPALLLILAALIGNYWLGGTHPAGMPLHDRHVEAKCFELNSKWNYTAWYMSVESNKFIRLTLEEVVANYGLEDAGITSYAELYPLTAKAQHVRLLWFLGGLIFLCAILPPVLLRYPINIGVPDLTAQLTGSRRKTALGKIVAFDLVVLLISLVSTLIQIWAFAGSIISQTNFGYVLYTVLLRLLIDLAVLSVPMYLAFLIRRIPGLVIVNIAYGVVCYFLNVAACNSDKLLPIPIPAYLHGLRPIWQQGGPVGWIAFAAAVSLAWIVLFAVLSVRCFQQEGEKRSGVREAKENLKAAK